MGKLVWAAIGFAAAALAAEYFLPISGLPYLAAALVVFSLFGLLFKGKRRRNAMILVLSAAAGLLLWWGRYTVYLAPWETLAGQDVTISARVMDYPEEGDSYTGLPIRITSGGARVKGYLYAYDEALSSLEPGDEITVEARVLSAMDNAAGARRHTHTAFGRGFLGRMLAPAEITGRWEYSWLYFPQRLARTVGRLCGEVFPASSAPFMRALLIGDKAELYEDAELYAAMRASGVLHIVAVSGMHILILAAFLRRLLGRGTITTVLTLPLLAVFVFMAGAGASVSRAALMQAVILLAPLLKREPDAPSALAAALLALLLINPMAIGGRAFQLSFSCVLGFVVLMPGMEAWCSRRLNMKNRLVRFAASSVTCTICATAFSLPISSYYFGVIPLFSWLAGLLTLFVVEILFAGGYVICLVGAIYAPLGAALGRVLGWLAQYCAAVWRLIGALPFSSLYTVSRGAAAWLFGVYALFILWFLFGRKRKIWALIPAEVCVIWLCIVLLTAGRPLTGGAELTLLNVGQGACAALLGENTAILVDCGGSGRINAGELAADYLLSRGKTGVDALVLTHLHEDHTNGVEALLARLPVSYIILPADHDDEDRMLDGILDAAERQGTRVLLLEEEAALHTGDMRLTLLLPEAGSDENDRGIVALAELADMTALIMGDAGTSAEEALLSRGLVPDVDVLVVGHHGSKSATGLLFLRAAAPETALISVGASNPYGHPAAETIERLEDYGAELLRTDKDGNITIIRKVDGTNG